MSKCFVAPGTGGVQATANAQQQAVTNSATLTNQAAQNAQAFQPMASSLLNSEQAPANTLSTYLSGGGTGGNPAASFLNTPDPQAVGAQVQQAYADAGNIATAQNLALDNGALQSAMAQRGLTGSTFNNSAQVGLQNASALQGGQNNLAGLMASLQASQAADSEQSGNFYNALGGLAGVQNQASTAANLIPVINASNSVASGYGNAGQTYAQQGQGFGQAVSGLGNLAGTALQSYLP